MIEGPDKKDKELTRRGFVKGAVGTAAGVMGTGGLFLVKSDAAESGLRDAFAQAAAGTSQVAAMARPILVSSSNGYGSKDKEGVRALERGMAVLKRGGDTVDAVLATVTVVEDDPEDNSVGYGGLPNEEGVVQLDASVMHGPTRRAAAVGCIENFKNPSLIARRVMDQIDHVMLVGEGARRYALAQGFEPMNLLTDASRRAWLAWKARRLPNWAPGLWSPEWKEQTMLLMDPRMSEEQKLRELAWIREVIEFPSTGTINCLAVDAKGDISGTTTTSGLAWKIPGRVGDSPVIGAGLYVDNDIGAAGSTGRGEENIRVSGAHTIVEMMRAGKSPKDACLEALSRVTRNYNGDKKKLSKFHLLFYAVNKDGVHGGASLWGGTRRGDRVVRRTYAVHDGSEARLVDCAYLFEGAEQAV